MNKTNEALQAGIDAAKPGKTADDVAQAFWKILDKYGIEKTSRTGYSIGIGYPPDWGEHTLIGDISKGDMTILEPNVAVQFHMIAISNAIWRMSGELKLRDLKPIKTKEIMIKMVI